MTDATTTTEAGPAADRSDEAAREAAITSMLTTPAGQMPDRRALVAYSAWLDQERRFLCHEMYPHLGWKAASFVIGSNAGFSYHRHNVPPASARAAAVLALAGCDWSKDSFLGVGEDERDKANPVPQSDHFPHPDARLMDLERIFNARRLVADEAASAHKLAFETFKREEAAFIEAERDLVMHEPTRAGLPPLYWTAGGVRRVLMGGGYGGSARDFEVAAATPQTQLRSMLPRLEAREGRQAALTAGLDLKALGDDADWALETQTKAADALYHCPAHTLEGLMIKVRILRADQPDLWKRPSFFDGPGAEPHELALTDIADGIEHLLSVRGLPGGSAVHDEGLPTSVFADITAITGGMHHDDGTVTYTDAAGKVHRNPVSDWIAFTAMRMVSKARTEMARQLCDPTLSDDARASLAVKLRADLRVDALHALAFRSRETFDAAQAEQDRLVYGEIPTRKVYLGDEVSPGLKAAIEAHREARQIGLQDSVEDDDRADATWARVRALAAVIRKTPARSMADLRWRMIYIWPDVIRDQMDDETRDNLHTFHDDVMRLAGMEADGQILGEPRPHIEKLEPATPPASDLSDAFPDACLVAEAIDIREQSDRTLVALNDAAALVADVARAVTCQPRCHVGSTYNIVGELMEWVVEVCNRVSDAAQKEAKTRSPDDSWDKAQLLTMLAGPIIQNGNQAETVAFARDLVGGEGAGS